ncbi:hypothetical protein [Deinococcus multiflagellatus]|uniref:Uncharacterized protein n=1 Tax=Deinococcus multiflagellatus TaxID=1656887 RepID=A0ABW1ZI10_9DEIO|nr:hypothetical protein [Deinococcus multiflagellatus]MBZ9713788.1 hypothetical protein [Deinococcus multiflagellatus]
MPPTEANLPGVLDDLFAAAAARGNGVRHKLANGLRLKAGLRGERRLLLVWRSGDRLPSATECEIVGHDAGFFQPRYQLRPCAESPNAFLITEGYRGDVCEHTWGPTDPLQMGKVKGERCVCTHCGAQWTRLDGRRPTTTYNGQKVRPAVLERWQVRGPVPPQITEEVPAEVLEALAEDRADVPVYEPAPSWRDRKAAKKAAPVDREAEARQQARDAAERKRLSGLLGLVDFWCIFWDPWFQRATVIAVRRDYLKGADLEDLRAEVRGRYFQQTLPHALPYVLLALRWRHVARALPEVATPAPVASKRGRKASTTRKPRSRKAAAA